MFYGHDFSETHLAFSEVVTMPNKSAAEVRACHILFITQLILR